MAQPPPPLPWPVTRAAANDAAPDHHHQQKQGHGGAGAEVRRAAKALLFLAAVVALPCLVLYHRAVVAPGDLRDDDAAADLMWRIDFSGQKNFMTDGYLKMMWRIDFLREVLERRLQLRVHGSHAFFNNAFQDTDIVWFRNPLPHFYPAT